MANNLVTENYLRLNFVPKSGITPGTDDHEIMKCTDITTRYNVLISPSSGNYCPKQSELIADRYVGEIYGGGVVGYIYQPGDPDYVYGECHGFIVADTDQGTAVPWVTGSYILTNANNSNLGDGDDNTILIYNTQGKSTTYAARLCYELVSGGKSDWYLPNINELLKIYQNQIAIGGISQFIYWSSSEIDLSTAHNLRMTDGVDGYGTKFGTAYVRAIRYF